MALGGQNQSRPKLGENESLPGDDMELQRIGTGKNKEVQKFCV